jgi:hypothetical protein
MSAFQHFMETIYLPFAAASLACLFIAIAWAGRRLADNLKRDIDHSDDSKP